MRVYLSCASGVTIGVASVGAGVASFAFLKQLAGKAEGEREGEDERLVL